jgi:sugar/nucleoside kinase (ribokinase family)
VAAPSPDSPDIVGFGALNVDYIAGASKLSLGRPDSVQESTLRFEWGAESAADEATVRAAVEQLGATALEASLGGSAWLTIFGLASMQVDLKLGYVGYLGRIHHPGLSFLRQMRALGIDHRFVGRDPERSCGVCVSYIEDGERVMLTHPGANAALADYLEANFDEVAQYFASARFVHVTSFLDERTPEVSHAVLARARELNPSLQVCLDPGHAWSRDPSPAVESLLRISDYVLLNYREFKALGRYLPGESDETVAEKVYADCARSCVLVVPKRYDVVEVFHRTGGLALSRFLDHPADGENAEVEDATGAGDVFAAGLLAALAERRLQVELGAFLGMSLAHRKLRRRGLELSTFPDLTKGFLQRLERPDEPERVPTGVFLAHGTDPQWRKVWQFLEEDCHLQVYGAQPGPSGEGQGEAMARLVALCGFAVCLLTGQDTMRTGHRYPDQSVVHQAGVFQGRVGFGRVALLVEEGVEIFSNVAGLICPPFRRGNVESTFWHLTRMLRREGLLDADPEIS